MAKSVKFADDAFVDEARLVSELQSRSLAGQIMHWARIGRAIERSGSFDHNSIARVLAGEAETTTLTAEEKAVWSERFLEKMSAPGPDETAFFTRLRARGDAVGLDGAGSLVRADPDTGE